MSMREEEVRFPFLAYSHLAESFYLKNHGTEKEDFGWLKQITAESRVAGKVCYYESEELKKEVRLYNELEKWKEQHPFPSEFLGGLVYILTIQERYKQDQLSQQERLLIQLWNCAYLDGIRSVFRSEMSQDKESFSMSLGAGFYGMSMNVNKIIYVMLKGKDYGIQIKNSSFLPSYSCCGIVINIKNFRKKMDFLNNLSPCIDCKGTDNCDFCVFRKG